MHFDQSQQRTVDTDEELEALELDLDLEGVEPLELEADDPGAGTFGAERRPDGPTFGADFGHWLHSALKVVATPITAPALLLGHVATDVEKEAKKVPVVGGLFAGLVDVTLGGPWHLATDVIHGVRVDKALMREFKRQIADFKAVGPYAEMVFSFVPGFGTIVAGCIGAGLALANGQPITKALLDGVAGAVPGGAIAQEAFRVGESALEAATSPGGFKRLGNWEKIGLEALPLPDDVKKPIEGGLKLVANLASGERIDKALAGAVVAALPAAVAGPLAPVLQTIQQAGISVPAVEQAVSTLAQVRSLAASLSPAAQTGLKAVQAAGVRMAQGQSVEQSIVEAAIAQVPSAKLSPAVQGAIASIHQAAGVVTGEANAAAQIADAAAAHARQVGGADLKPILDALRVGAALGHGKAVQDLIGTQATSGAPPAPAASPVAAHGPAAPGPSPMIAGLLRRGDERLRRDRVARAGFSLWRGPNAWGYRLGLGLSRHPVGLGPAAAIRRAAVMHRAAAGFDAAIALSAGQALGPPPAIGDKFTPVPGRIMPPDPSELAAAGYHTAAGLEGAPEATRRAVLAPVAAHPDARAGAERAMAEAEDDAPWTERFWATVEGFFRGLVDFL